MLLVIVMLILIVRVTNHIVVIITVPVYPVVLTLQDHRQDLDVWGIVNVIQIMEMVIVLLARLAFVRITE